MDRVVPYGNRPFPECGGELESECSHPRHWDVPWHRAIPILGTRMSPSGTGLSHSVPCKLSCLLGDLGPCTGALAPWHSPIEHGTSTAPAWHHLAMVLLWDANNRVQRARETQGSSKGQEAGGSLGTQEHGGCKDSDSWCFFLKQECPPFKFFLAHVALSPGAARWPLCTAPEGIGVYFQTLDVRTDSRGDVTLL